MDTIFSDTPVEPVVSPQAPREVSVGFRYFASQPDFSARLWAVDTAKEIFRFIHEKSRLREELEKHNKELLLITIHNDP